MTRSLELESPHPLVPLVRCPTMLAGLLMLFVGRLSGRALRLRLTGTDLPRKSRAEHVVVQIRTHNQEAYDRALEPEHPVEARRRALEGVIARRERDAGRDRDPERGPPDRPPAPAERVEQLRARLSLEPLRGRNRDEDERDRSSHPDDRGQQVGESQREQHAASL